jgi:hypothetical protein
VEQFNLLLDHHSMYLQGYLLSHPVSRDELIPLLPQLTARAQDLLLTSRKPLSGTVVEFAPRSARDATKAI